MKSKAPPVDRSGDQEKIFQSFVQIESGLNRQFTESGLCLSSVKRILLVHGGDIRMRSSLGHGTRFSVHLPISLATETATDGSDPETGQGDSAEPGTCARMDRPLILLAEDSREGRLMHSHDLSAKGYQVHQVVNGQEAIDFLHDHVPQLLIINQSMPNVDGFSVRRMIRSSDWPDLAELPPSC